MAELTTLARPYAKAAFNYALAQQDLQGWSSTLNVLAAVCAKDKVKAALSSPALTAEQQMATLANICGSDLKESAKNFIGLLAENKRLLLLPTIAEQFEILKNKQEQLSQVLITSAFELAEDTQSNLAKALEKKLNCSVEVSTAVDNNLIGGAVIRAGDLVIDSSVRGRLSKLTESVNS